MIRPCNYDQTLQWKSEDWKVLKKRKVKIRREEYWRREKWRFKRRERYWRREEWRFNSIKEEPPPRDSTLQPRPLPRQPPGTCCFRDFKNFEDFKNFKNQNLSPEKPADTFCFQHSKSKKQNETRETTCFQDSMENFKNDTREAPCRSLGLNCEIADSISAHPCHWATSWWGKVKVLTFKMVPLRQRPHLPREWSPQSSCQLSRPQRRPWRSPAAWQGTPAWGAGSPCSSPPGGSNCNLEPVAFAGLEGSALANLVFDLAKSISVGIFFKIWCDQDWCGLSSDCQWSCWQAPQSLGRYDPRVCKCKCR